MRSRRTPSTPRVAPVHLEGLVPADPDGLDAGVLLEGVRLADADLPPVNLAGAELAEVEVARVSADDVDLIGARLREVSLAEVRFAALRAAHADWRDSQLSGRVGLLDAHEGEWRSVILTGCKIDFLSLRGARVEDVLVTGCTIGELDLTGATVSRVRLADTRVGTLEAHDLRSEHLDLRGAEFDRVGGFASLRGALVTPDQVARWAPALAEALGLRVVEDVS